jgi:hypothetical protein
MFGASRWLIYIIALLLASPVSGGEPHDKPLRALTSEEFMVANALWTLLHETAHAVIAQMDLPFFGSEEDAADQIATIVLLRGNAYFDVADSVAEVETVIAAATAWRVEWELEQRDGIAAAYWESRPLSIQRFYTMMCLLYGSDPDKYGQTQEQLGLPYEGAYGCLDYENERARRAVQWLIEARGRQQNDARSHGKVFIVYEKTLTKKQHAMAAAIQRAGIAQRVARHIESMQAFGNDITIAFAQCAGQATAFWRQDSQEIVLCYELLSRFLYLYQAKQCLEQTGLSEADLDACLARWQY